MLIQIAAVLIGVVAGVASGFLGIGGGVVLVPALVLILGFGQHAAQGVSLAAIVLGIGPGLYVYYKNGHVNFPVVALVALGVIIGGVIGARMAVNIDAGVLRKVFGAVLLLLAIRMLLYK